MPGSRTRPSGSRSFPTDRVRRPRCRRTIRILRTTTLLVRRSHRGPVPVAPRDRSGRRRRRCCPETFSRSSPGWRAGCRSGGHGPSRSRRSLLRFRLRPGSAPCRTVRAPVCLPVRCVLRDPRGVPSTAFTSRTPGTARTPLRAPPPSTTRWTRSPSTSARTPGPSGISCAVRTRAPFVEAFILREVLGASGCSPPSGGARLASEPNPGCPRRGARRSIRQGGARRA